jgi:hypothetical protein
MKHEGIGGVTRFIIMNNLFNTPFEPVEIYDLKVREILYNRNVLIIATFNLLFEVERYFIIDMFNL